MTENKRRTLADVVLCSKTHVQTNEVKDLIPNFFKYLTQKKKFKKICWSNFAIATIETSTGRYPTHLILVAEKH